MKLLFFGKTDKFVFENTVNLRQKTAVIRYYINCSIDRSAITDILTVNSLN